MIAGFAALVVLHEAGHFTAAKMVGMRVEKFFLFFPPKVVSIRRGETEYGIKLIPLGGYVAGADASVDKAVKMFPAIERFLRQDMREPAALELVQSRLQILFPIAKKAEGQ